MILAGLATLPGMNTDDAERHRLEAAFTAYAPRVWGYARRHAEHNECDDVVAETFAIAWRRIDRMPSEPLPWLLVVARNVLANRRRTAERADRLWFAAVRELWQHVDSPEEGVAERDSFLRALEACTRVEREALLLVAWEGLTPGQAAAVAGCSTRAFTVRLHRARRRIVATAGQDAAAVTDSAEPRLRLVRPSSPAGGPLRRGPIAPEGPRP